ncbi:histidine kinase [Xylanimonas cellulosilytica DSM 15894]|uniref:histidine kinase n=1 Tax=Xylanimonas cellulosilytica (strain DSM 15894 / JCM 12276 / CECT 5975 / KCTC 9989 / LMG 20990 / NBRC 107835 / XIL07) TaxID=446471 RepID=D1BXT9_XYLCX|nr:histidine kinase [Xylanimonas cellulosilytica]ACZ31730.1 histidine kinase [Xylanimonas cellulosilytica DSM 15894]
MDRARPRLVRPSRAETTAAVAVGVLTLAGLLALPLVAAAEPDERIVAPSPADPGWWLVVALLLAQAIALLAAKRSTRLVLAVVAVVPALHAVAVPGATFSLTTVAVAAAIVWAVLRRPLRSLSAVVPAAGLLVAGAQYVNDVRSGSAPGVATLGAALLQAFAIVAVALAVGLVVAARHDARVARGHELLALRREHDALVQAAVARERVAMSRELHDIAAHHMSGIALLASAIYRQVDLDPEAAKVSAQQVRAQSTTVLDDLRRVIGLLRDEAESPRSVETLAAVRELVERRRAAGADVELVAHTGTGTGTGTGTEVLGAGIGTLAQLVAYRMVQESLANAAAHAPGARCVVEIDDRQPDRLTVLVTNDASHAPDPGPGGGFGLVGMRERAELVDAELHHGPTADGGWQVRLTLRRDAILDDVPQEPA